MVHCILINGADCMCNDDSATNTLYCIYVLCIAFVRVNVRFMRRLGGKWEKE